MTGRLAALVAAALAAAPLAAADDRGAIEVALKDFTFKAPEELKALFAHNEAEGKLAFYTNGPAEATVKVPEDGDYEITVKASGDPGKDGRAKFKVSVDGTAVTPEVLLTADEPKDYKLAAKLKAGPRKLTVEFLNDAYKENEYDRNLFVHAVSLRKAK
jgi:hypothetical protein